MNDHVPDEVLEVSSDSAYDDMKQDELDRSVAAFDKWLEERRRLDVIDRLPALFGWHAGREYQAAINTLELSQLRSQVVELERENSRMAKVVQMRGAA